ncbi:MAG: hypothetical protein RIR26_682, partial [Pseudomonadota bacterium]
MSGASFIKKGGRGAHHVALEFRVASEQRDLGARLLEVG